MGSQESDMTERLSPAQHVRRESLQMKEKKIKGSPGHSEKNAAWIHLSYHSYGLWLIPLSWDKLGEAGGRWLLVRTWAYQVLEKKDVAFFSQSQLWQYWTWDRGLSGSWNKQQSRNLPAQALGGSTPHKYARRPQPGEGPEEPGRAELVLPSLGLGGGKETGDASISLNASPSWVDCRLPCEHQLGLSGWGALGFPPAESAEERDEMLRRGEKAQKGRTQRSSCTHRKQRQGHPEFLKIGEKFNCRQLSYKL